MGNGDAKISQPAVETQQWDDGTDASIDTGEDVAMVVDLRFGEPQIVLSGDAAVAAPLSSPHTVPDLPIEPVEPTLPGTGRTADVIARVASRTSPAYGSSVTYRTMKRTADLIVSTLLFVLLLPLFLFIAALVAFTSKGPVFYRHKRIGLNGHPYTMLKFRTMVADADQRIDEMEALAAEGKVHPDAGPAFKAPDDPRVTRVGKAIRRTGLDELPQLLNIIAGTMSIIGPRPLVAKEVATMAPADAELRHQARPGVSCIWQVTRTSEMSFEERIALDLEYVQHRSVMLDLLLLLMTPVAILRGEGTH